MDSTAFFQFLQQRTLMNGMYISAAALLVYDYMLTIHLEIKFIWSLRWRYTEVIFLLVRYMPFIGTVFTLYNQLSFETSPKTCKMTYPVTVWLVILKLILAEVILAVRTWAIWRRNRIVGVSLAALTIANLVVQCIMANSFVNSLEYAPPPYPGFRGCFVTKDSRILWASCASLAAVEAIVLAFIAISAFRTYKQNNKNKFSYVIYRDGIMFYVYLLCITVANGGILIAAPIGLTVLLAPLEDVLYSVFTARIILNIRGVADHGTQTELHTTYESTEILPFTTPSTDSSYVVAAIGESLVQYGR